MDTSEVSSQHKGFNDEPVYYCLHCLSLKIREIDGIEFCDECSSINIDTSTIDSWEEKYENQYGHKFIQ